MRMVYAFLCALLMLSIMAPPRVAADNLADGAPVDEYFGRLQMSPLGVRNELHRLEQRADANQAHAEKIFRMADLVEDSLRDWQRKYPRDSWLPDRLRLLVEVYTHVHTPAGLVRARHALAWLLSITTHGSDANRAIQMVARQVQATLAARHRTSPP